MFQHNAARLIHRKREETRPCNPTTNGITLATHRIKKRLQDMLARF
jgi:hypothetical protein